MQGPPNCVSRRMTLVPHGRAHINSNRVSRAQVHAPEVVQAPAARQPAAEHARTAEQGRPLVRARVRAVECLRAVFVLLDLLCVYSICFDLICARRRSNQIKREIDQARRTAQARGRLRAACCLTRPSQPRYQTSRITSKHFKSNGPRSPLAAARAELEEPAARHERDHPGGRAAPFDCFRSRIWFDSF